LKDHFIKALVEEGMSKNRARTVVYRAIRKSNALKICLDLANAEKHSGLDCEGWSGRVPEMTSLSWPIQGQSLDKLVFNADGSIVTSVAKPEQVDYSISIIDKKDTSWAASSRSLEMLYQLGRLLRDVRITLESPSRLAIQPAP